LEEHWVFLNSSRRPSQIVLDCFVQLHVSVLSIWELSCQNATFRKVYGTQSSRVIHLRPEYAKTGTSGLQFDNPDRPLLGYGDLAMQFRRGSKTASLIELAEKKPIH
jgi:hypothetical protein